MRTRSYASLSHYYKNFVIVNEDNSLGDVYMTEEKKVCSDCGGSGDDHLFGDNSCPNCSGTGFEQEEVLEDPPEENEKKEFIWTTKDGRDIPLSKMTTLHLLNAHRFVRRKLVKAQECTAFYLHPVWGPQGEMAQDAAGQAMEQIWNEEMRVRVVERILHDELDRRGSAPLPIEEPRKLPEPKLVETLEHGRIYQIVKEEEEKDVRRQDPEDPLASMSIGEAQDFLGAEALRNAKSPDNLYRPR